MTINKRLIFWLAKAYVKRWGKTILLYFIIGLGVFFLLLWTARLWIAKFPLTNKQIIGIVGVFNEDDIPAFILDQMSSGLTTIGPDGLPKPALATSWEIKDSGKTYVMHLKQHVFFNDGSVFTSKDMTPLYADVTISRPDDATIIFHLKESYSPFLVTLSHPIFKNPFVGVGAMRLSDIKINGPFVTSMTLVSNQAPYTVKIYKVYPTEEAVKIAFALGNVSQAMGLGDEHFSTTSFDKFSHVEIAKAISYDKLITIFYNTQDKVISDKRLRDALAYGLPDVFAQGKRADSPYSPLSFAYTPDTIHVQDTAHAKLLLQSVSDNGKNTLPTLTIQTLSQYEPIAKTIAASWAAIGIKTNILVVDQIPLTFQVFLGSFNEPLDPDQYTLWHSQQVNNITNYKSLRIDKLLEDGRKTIDISARKEIYQQFQKYLLDDQPASFLYFPYSYTVTRK